MERKKITILMLHLQYGGIEKQTITFANELSKKYAVEIISIYSMNKEPAYPIDKNIKIKYLINDEPNRSQFRDAIKSKNIIKIVKEGLKAVKILYLKKKLMIQEIKNLDTNFAFSTRVEYANMLSKYAPNGIIKITEEHLHNNSKKYIRKIKNAFKNIDFLITIGKGSTENYSKWLEKNKKIKIVEIPNILEYVPKERASLDKYNIISVGRLHEIKDFPTLVRVFNMVQKEINDARLTIVGDGGEYNNIIKLINELNLTEKVTMTGMVTKNEVEKYMLDSDLYVMTSLTECFPMVLLEAFSVGLPVISFDVPVGPMAIIENEQNGYLIENRNETEMAKKIIEIFRDREKLKKFGINAKESSMQYLPEKIMNKWYEIFDN